MRWVLWIVGSLVGIAVLAVAVLYVMSRREGANVMVTEVVVNRPPAEVWPWVTEPELQKKWVSWLVEIKDLHRTPNGVGSRATWVMEDKNNNNQKMEIHSEVTKYDVNRLVEVNLNTPPEFTGVASYTLTDLGNGSTRVISRGEYNMNKAIFKLMMPLVIPSAKKKMNADFASMKKQIESAQPSAAAASR
jgi:uncharacterized protein YndB with AHSA1/START domain